MASKTIKDRCISFFVTSGFGLRVASTMDDSTDFMY